MTGEHLTSNAIGISDDRNTELSFFAGVIQMEIAQEYGEHVSRVHIVRAALASPYLIDEVERAWVIATLCEALPGPGYGLSLIAFRRIWEFWPADYPIERKISEYTEAVKIAEGGGKAV